MLFPHGRTAMRALGSLVLGLALAMGCSPGGSGRRDSGGGHTGFDGSFTPYDAGFQECVAETTTAETILRPVDIVWIVDRSGSMDDEALIVQNNINAFAASIGTSGIDYHVVMVCAAAFLSVPPPLGDDPERFLYVEEDVQSHDGLSDLITRFDSYSAFLRPHATTHFVVVTDDESENMNWEDFQSMMRTRLGHSFVFHAIASPPGSTHTLDFCFPPIPCEEEGCESLTGDEDAPANGDEYWELANATGGRQFSICTDDWSGLFGTLTDAIAIPMPLPCRYTLPEPPDGGVVNRNQVNFVFTPTGGVEQWVPYVEHYGNCSGQGWYYEGDEIVVCPATCDTLGADETGSVEIALGCATILI
jgi:hypothetical protein